MLRITIIKIQKIWSSLQANLQNKLSVVRYPMCFGSFIVSTFLNPHIMPTWNTKIPYITSIRCVTNYTTIKAFRDKVTLISHNISFLSNIPLLRMMMHMMHFLHFLLYWLITILNKDSFARTWFTKFRVTKPILSLEYLWWLRTSSNPICPLSYLSKTLFNWTIWKESDSHSLHVILYFSFSK